MTKIDVSKLTTIPFLDHKELHGRFLCSLLFYDGTWRGWIEAGDRVVETKMWPAEAVYFGTSPEQKTDVCLHFLDLIAQRLSYLPLGRQLFAMQEDLCNLSASLRKIRLLHEAKKEKQDIRNGVGRLVATEVEYLYGVCRSTFDLWEEVVASLWDGITLLDRRVKKRQLKQSYRDMVFSGEKLRTAEELTQRFGLPPPIADCYVRSAGFFADLRKFRDRIIHQGASVQVIFEGEQGFLIAESRWPFHGIKLWKSQEYHPNGLVPLMPALRYIIFRTLEICDDFSRTAESAFKLPPPLVPGFHLYLRGYFDNELVEALEDTRRRMEPANSVAAWPQIKPE